MAMAIENLADDMHQGNLVLALKCVHDLTDAVIDQKRKGTCEKVCVKY